MNNVARYVSYGIARVGPGGWARLVASGLSPLPNRQWLKIQAKGKNALAILYTMKDSSGTYTAPTENTHRAVVYPGNSVIVEPISDNVMVWGRCIPKAGSTDGGLRVVVAEFA